MPAYTQPMGVSPITKETQIFCQILLERAAQTGVKSVLDVGCGTGYLAVELARAGYTVCASDINEFALEATEENANEHKVALTLRHSDLLSDINGTFDMIAFNAPLGDRGTSKAVQLLKSVIRRIPLIRRMAAEAVKRTRLGTRTQMNLDVLAQAPKHLTSGGRIYLLVYMQELSAIETAAIAPLTQRYHQDLAEGLLVLEIGPFENK